MDAFRFFRKLIEDQKNGVARCIVSVCSANKFVIKAAMELSGETREPLLIESTSNQVNQSGGYTGMTPFDFRDYIFSMAEEIGFPKEKIILGGDHLGPYPWRAEKSEKAMEKACKLVSDCVRAGYEKIHLDASMPLGEEREWEGIALKEKQIAEREAYLAKEAEWAFGELKKEGIKADRPLSPPVYVVGTEVPRPGGSKKEDEGIRVTSVTDFRNTVSSCWEAFERIDLQSTWDRVIAVVVQPGVEFGNRSVHEYDRDKAKALCREAKLHPSIVLEGHSTDYQQACHLKQLVEDGIAVLKVGPALTFALRETFFRLEHIERTLLVDTKRRKKLSRLEETLEKAMLENPVHWEKYYTGDERQRVIDRKYSFLDRIRYYWNIPELKQAVDRLLDNLHSVSIPLPVVSQFLPYHYKKLREGKLQAEPERIILESIKVVLREYSSAANYHFFTL